MSSRYEKISTDVDMNELITAINHRFDQTYKKINILSDKVDALEEKIDGLEEKMGKGFSEIKNDISEIKDLLKNK